MPIQAPTAEALRPLMKSKRLNELKDACALLADGLSGFDELIEKYVQVEKRNRRDTPNRDCERFLEWLESKVQLTDQQRDMIVNQQSRHAVEFVALKQRIAHLRYEEMLSNSQPFQKHSAQHLGELVYLNPVHVWATFDTHAFIEDESPIPATVLFYPAAGSVRTAVIDEQSEQIIRELEQGPQKLRTLLKQTPKEERETFLEAIQRLVSLKILALAS
ncbi:hypothetical protein [Thalassoglobus polymorphus]|nr:hypothetical protein [Thalassoglobus polymorphus]